MKITIIKLAAAFIFSVITLNSAIACSCMPTDADTKVAVEQAYQRADRVVLATAVDQSHAGQSAAWQDTGNEHQNGSARQISAERGRYQTTSFLVLQRWKGAQQAIVKTQINIDCCMCGARFTVGETYLLYLYNIPNSAMYHTSICDLNSHYEDAAQYIDALNQLPTLEDSIDAPNN